ncbi:MAG: hypothetical protein ACREJ4_12870 [Candidatus Methylomirabilaceae bacterium]
MPCIGARAVDRRLGVSGNAIGLFLLPLVVACQTAPLHTTSSSLVRKTVPSSLQVPLNVERLAVLYPKTYSRELLDAYARLEGAAFQLKEQRPFLRIVDRFDLPTLRGEQRFQLGGAVSDESAIRLGRLLGVDSVLFFRIEGPNFRDQVFARFHGDLPPFTVTSKIILVESAEVVFHNVVTSPVERFNGPRSFFYSDFRVEPQVRAALDRGVVQTIADLSHAFR